MGFLFLKEVQNVPDQRSGPDHYTGRDSTREKPNRPPLYFVHTFLYMVQAKYSLYFLAVCMNIYYLTTHIWTAYI